MIHHSTVHSSSSDAASGNGTTSQHLEPVAAGLTTSGAQLIYQPDQHSVEDDALGSHLFSLSDETNLAYPITSLEDSSVLIPLQDATLANINLQESSLSSQLDSFIVAPSLSPSFNKSGSGKRSNDGNKYYHQASSCNSLNYAQDIAPSSESDVTTSAMKKTSSSCIVRSVKQYHNQQQQLALQNTQAKVSHVVASTQSHCIIVSSPQTQLPYTASGYRFIQSLPSSSNATSVTPVNLHQPIISSLCQSSNYTSASLSHATTNVPITGISKDPMINSNRANTSRIQVTLPTRQQVASQPTPFPSINEAIAKSEVVHENQKYSSLDFETVSSNSMLNKLLENNIPTMPKRTFKLSDYVKPSVNQGLSGLLSNATDLPDKNLRAIIVTNAMSSITQPTKYSSMNQQKRIPPLVHSVANAGLEAPQNVQMMNNSPTSPTSTCDVNKLTQPYHLYFSAMSGDNPNILHEAEMDQYSQCTLQGGQNFNSLLSQTGDRIARHPIKKSRRDPECISDENKQAISSLENNQMPHSSSSTAISEFSCPATLSSPLFSQSTEGVDVNRFRIESKFPLTKKDTSLISQDSSDILLSDAHLHPEQDLNFANTLGDDLQGGHHSIVDGLESNDIAQDINNSSLNNNNPGLVASDIFTANGIKASFASSTNLPHCSSTSDMVFSFPSNFLDNSNMSMDISNLLDDDISDNCSSFINPSEKPINSQYRKPSCSSELSFSHLLKPMDDLSAKSKLPLLRAHDISKAMASIAPEEAKVTSEDAKFSFHGSLDLSSQNNFKRESKISMKRKDSVRDKDYLVQQLPCFRCRVCSFLCLEKNAMQNHMKQEHPEYLIDNEDKESDEQNFKTKRIKVFLPRTTSSSNYPNSNISSQAMLSKFKPTLEPQQSKKYVSQRVINEGVLPEHVFPLSSDITVPNTTETQTQISNSSLNVKICSPNDASSSLDGQKSPKHLLYDSSSSNDNKLEEDRKPFFFVDSLIDGSECQSVQSSSEDKHVKNIKTELEVSGQRPCAEPDGGVFLKKQYTNRTGRPRAAQTLGIAKLRRNKTDASISEEKLLGIRCDIDGLYLTCPVAPSEAVG